MKVLIVWGLAGIIYSIYYRHKSRTKEQSFISIIVNDFNFENYATISFLSFIYALVQGAGFGLSIGFIMARIMSILSNLWSMGIFCPNDWSAGCQIGNEYYLYSILSALAVVIARLVIEGYIISFKLAQVLIKRFGGQ